MMNIDAEETLSPRVFNYKCNWCSNVLVCQNFKSKKFIQYFHIFGFVPKKTHFCKLKVDPHIFLNAPGLVQG